MAEIKLSAIQQSRPHQYLIRFAFGGAATVLAGLVSRHFGPGPGGIFLAFPAIFPASVTLIESHERKRKAKLDRNGTFRGRVAASVDSAGAALGCLGLFALASCFGSSCPTTAAGWLFRLPPQPGPVSPAVAGFCAVNGFSTVVRAPLTLSTHEAIRSLNGNVLPASFSVIQSRSRVPEA